MVRAAVITWAAIVKLAEPNESPCWEEAWSSLSISLWRGTNLSLQAVQVWAEGTILSHDGCSLGNKLVERRAEVDIAAIQSRVIGREARLVFFCALSNMLINSGTRGSSSHHRYMVADMATTSARSIPPLCVARRSGRSFRATRV